MGDSVNVPILVILGFCSIAARPGGQKSEAKLGERARLFERCPEISGNLPLFVY